MNEDFRSYKDVSFEEIIDLSKQTIFPIGENPCIYFLVRDSEIVYVGQTWNIYSRIGAHSKSKVFDSVAVYEANPNDMNNLEAAYILRFNPVYNKILPKSDFITEKRARSIYGTHEITNLLATGQITRYSIHSGNFFNIDELESVHVI